MRTCKRGRTVESPAIGGATAPADLMRYTPVTSSIKANRLLKKRCLDPIRKNTIRGMYFSVNIKCMVSNNAQSCDGTKPSQLIFL